MPDTMYLNKTAGEEHQVVCPSCSRKTVHKVLVSADLRGDSSDGVSWAVDNQVIQCLGCKTTSFRSAQSSSEDCVLDEVSGDREYMVTERLYPSRVKGRSPMSVEQTYLVPHVVRRIYEETIVALSNDAPVLAGIGIRAILETVCKDKKAKGSDLFQRINSLVETRVLTPVSAEILHMIRTLGNKAAHEVKPHSARQLGLAMDVVEHLLKDVYILPAQAEDDFL